jgi:hypothetical protein
MPTSSVTTGSPVSLASPVSIVSASSSSPASAASSSTLVVLAAGACDAFLYLSQHGLPSYDRYILLDRLPYANEKGSDEEDIEDERSSLYRALTKSKGRFFRVLSRLYDEATVHDADACVVHFDRHQKIAYHYNVENIQGLLPGQHPLPQRFDLFLSARSPTPAWLSSFLAPPSLASSSDDAPPSPPSCRPHLFLFGHELDASFSKGLASQQGQVEVVDLAAAVEGWEARQPRRWGNVLGDVRVMEKKEKKEEVKKRKKANKTTRKEMEEEAGEGGGIEGRKTKKGKKEGEDAGDKKMRKEEEKEKEKIKEEKKDTKEKKKPAKKMPDPFVRT